MKATITEVKSRLHVRENKQEGIQNYDIDNAYPQRIRNAKKSSGRTTQCVNIHERFVRGKGFPDPFFKTIVNERKRLTVDKMHRKHIQDYALLRGIAVHFNYNMLGEKVSMDHIPFEELRLGLEDEKTGVVTKIKHHRDWARETGKNFKKADVTEFDVYNPDPAVVIAQAEAAGGFAKYKGQILWWSASGPWKYPEASCDPVLEDVVADDEVKQFRLNNIASSFLASHVFRHPKFEDEGDRRDYHEKLNQFQGARNASKIFDLEEDNPTESSFSIEKLDVTGKDGLFEITEKSVLDSIRRAYFIPKPLLSDDVAGDLGNDSKKIEQAYNYYNSMTSDDRMIFEELYTEFFVGWHQGVVTTSFTVMPLTYDTPKVNVQPGN